MDKLDYTTREMQVRNLLDALLDAAIEGDFKTVKKYAKKIYKLAQEGE
ncbi:MAG TPA: hypothetical protein VF941_11975 [Clostridia bacterium]